jgi:hypothetical protein
MLVSALLESGQGRFSILLLNVLLGANFCKLLSQFFSLSFSNDLVLLGEIRS